MSSTSVTAAAATTNSNNTTTASKTTDTSSDKSNTTQKKAPKILPLARTFSERKDVDEDKFYVFKIPRISGKQDERYSLAQSLQFIQERVQEQKPEYKEYVPQPEKQPSMTPKKPVPQPAPTAPSQPNVSNLSYQDLQQRLSACMNYVVQLEKAMAANKTSQQEPTVAQAVQESQTSQTPYDVTTLEELIHGLSMLSEKAVRLEELSSEMDKEMEEFYKRNQELLQ